MLIDWVTFRIPESCFDIDDLRRIQALHDRVIRLTGNGQMVWETTAWDSIRSDSHQISFRVTSDFLWIQGSPARIIGDGDNVFSSGASAALDLRGCVFRMAAFVGSQLEVSMPEHASKYLVSRVDVTQNLKLNSLAEVRQALTILRDCEGGRYRVSQQAGDSVYWSHRSRFRSGKAYAKGAQLVYAMKKAESPDFIGRKYTTEEIALANSLLRLELKLGSQYWRETAKKKWFDYEASDLSEEWESYFGRMIGGAEIMEESDVKERIFQVAETEGRAKAAFGTWALICSQGWEAAREMQARATWYRNLQTLRAAGLSDADLSTGKVVQLRRKVFEAQAVNTWAELRLAS